MSFDTCRFHFPVHQNKLFIDVSNRIYSYEPVEIIYAPNASQARRFTRYFMDKVVDHLLVFKGDGVIKDFPGNYTQYREWLTLKGRDEALQDGKATRQPKRDYRNADKRKMTYKEKTEYAQLEKDIAALEEEQRQIEEALCGGTVDIDTITAMSKRLPQLKDELDEKSMRWLELSEIE